METKEILGFVLTVINILITVWNLIVVNYIAKRQDARAKNYSELDKAYDELLKDAADNPDLRNPAFPKNMLTIKRLKTQNINSHTSLKFMLSAV